MDSTSNAALIAAGSAVAVALIGLVGNLLTRKRDEEAPDPRTDEVHDTPTLLTALSAALADGERLRQRGDRWKERAIACEARESTRTPPQRQSTDGTAP
ncbi:MAG: hypothetical protein ACXV3V_05045 [Actinomycetes bacterium]